MEGVILPIVKKGEGLVEEYRGVTMMPSLYKIYASVLAERLRVETEEKSISPHNQTDFRKGMGMMDNVCILNYVINRQLAQKGGKVLVLFVDLKAVFDMIDREVLLESMRERGIREGLVKRMEKMLRETKSRVRVEEETGKAFWMAREVRQECPLSPLLFSLLIADLEETLKKVGWGGIKIRGKRVCSLMYTDDIVLIAEKEGEMKSMI